MARTMNWEGGDRTGITAEQALRACNPLPRPDSKSAELRPIPAMALASHARLESIVISSIVNP